MKKLFVVLALAFIYACETPAVYQVKYAIDLDNTVAANVTYKVGDTYKTATINSDTWESETFEINDDLYYYYIKLDSYASTGNFYIIVDNEVHNTSMIGTNTGIENIFSGYIDMNGDETTSVNIGL